MNCPGAAARRSSMRGCALFDQFGLLDHHHRVGAARDHAAGGDRGRGAGRDLQRRRMAAGDHLGIERKQLRTARRWRRRCRPRAPRSRRHWSGRTAAHRPRPPRHAPARASAHPPAPRVSARSGDRSRCFSKRARASSADTTSRNCSCRAAARTRAISSASSLRSSALLMLVSRPRPHLHRRAGGITFAVGRHQDPAVGARQRRQRQIFRRQRLEPVRRCAAPARLRPSPPWT